MNIKFGYNILNDIYTNGVCTFIQHDIKIWKKTWIVNGIDKFYHGKKGVYEFFFFRKNLIQKLTTKGTPRVIDHQAEVGLLKNVLKRVVSLPRYSEML